MASFLDQVFGAKPQVAPFEPTDPLAELTTLLGGEIKDWSQITNLSNLYEDYMLSALNKAIPGFSDILNLGSEDVRTALAGAKPLLEGVIPPDVAAQVARSGAFRSLGAGTAGSPLGGALTARDLGLTSIDLMGKGAELMGAGTNAAQRWSDIASRAILPPSASMYSPQWFSEFMQGQRAAEQATKQRALNIAAAPDPALQALNQWVEQIGGTVIGSYLGGGMGGGKNYQTSYNAAQYSGGENVGATPGGLWNIGPGSNYAGYGTGTGYGNFWGADYSTPPTDVAPGGGVP